MAKEKTIGKKLSIASRSTKRKLERDILARKIKLRRSLEYKRLMRIRRKYVPPYTHCKNCGTELKGMYCHNCGQYALDARQPFWRYILQYFENVYQFDTKIWNTLWLLFRRPGFLTTEFNAGKIASYVHPMRLFMCITLLFFIYFFMVVGDKVDNAMENQTESLTEMLDDLDTVPEATGALAMVPKDTTVVLAADADELKSHPELFDILEIEEGLRNGDRCDPDTVKVRMSSAYLDYFELEESLGGLDLYTVGHSEFRDKEIKFKDTVLEILSSYAPLFSLLLVPVMAFMLKGLYRKKHLMYMNHLVFSLHWGSFFYIMAAIYIVVGELWTYSGTPFHIFLWISLIYTALALHAVYGNGWVKTIMKTFVLFFVYTFVALILTAALFGVVIYMNKQSFDL